MSLLNKSKLLEVLESLGAGDASHSDKTLLQHLEGTYNLLKEWGADEVVCVAGLYHSIYGTVYFNTATVDQKDRNKIQESVPML